MHTDLPDDPAPVPRRLRTTTALVTLLVSLPSTALGGLLVFGFGALFGSPPAAGLTLLWLFGGAFVPPPTGDAAPWIFPVRRPRPGEQGVLSAAWHSVAQAAGVRPGDYSLWVEETEQLNALAAPGRIVVVTSAAVAELGPRELEAILAHELGHHLGGGQRARMLAYWYALPITLLWRILRRITWALGVFVAKAAHIVGLVILLRGFGVRRPMEVIAVGVAVVARIGVLLGAAVLALLHFGVVVAVPLTAILLEPFAEKAQLRRSELDADRVAVDLGYGTEIRAVFSMWAKYVSAVTTSRRQVVARLLDSHPSLETRIEAIESRMGAGESG